MHLGLRDAPNDLQVFLTCMRELRRLWPNLQHREKRVTFDLLVLSACTRSPYVEAMAPPVGQAGARKSKVALEVRLVY